MTDDVRDHAEVAEIAILKQAEIVMMVWIVSKRLGLAAWHATMHSSKSDWIVCSICTPFLLNIGRMASSIR
jgi:hypothetical protein